MEIICGIYKIENKINNKVYIGQSVDVYTRWYNHKHDLRNGTHYNLHLQKSWNKYGENSFDFCIVEQCDKNDLDRLEIEYIAFYKSYDGKLGYNLTLGGEGGIPNEETRERLSQANAGENNPMFGKCHTDRTKEIISIALSGQNNPMFGRRGVDSPNYGRRCSDAHKQQISISNSGKHLSEASRMKQSLVKTGKHNPRAISVYCIELNEVFGCMQEAYDKYGISSDGISRCLAGKQASAGRHPLTKEKLHWVRADEWQVAS